MTVRELIECLSVFDLDSEVVVVDNGVDPPTACPTLCVTEYVPGEITIEY